MTRQKTEFLNNVDSLYFTIYLFRKRRVFVIISKEVMMPTVKEKLLKEIEDLPADAQEKIFKVVHLIKEEILNPKKKKTKGKNALSDIDKFAIDTGISDLSFQHDHYLYGLPKK